MSYSYTLFLGTGSTSLFTFPFPYIKPEHVLVFVDGAATSYTYINSNAIKIEPAPANGQVIEIIRETPKDTPPVNFTDGSVLLEADLDLLALYATYIAQELSDANKRSIYQTPTGTYTALGQRVGNVADPVNPQDVVTKNYHDATYLPQILALTAQSTTQSAAAITSATSAAISEASALSSKNSATLSASQAAASASQAAAGGVTSFNTRFGGVTLTAADVTGALAYTPVKTVNGSTGDVVFTIPPAASLTPTTIAAVASVGLSTSFARENHVHDGVTSVNGLKGEVTVTSPTAAVTAPPSVGTAAVGSLISYAKSDHTHSGVTSVNGQTGVVTVAPQLCTDIILNSGTYIVPLGVTQLKVTTIGGGGGGGGKAAGSTTFPSQGGAGGGMAIGMLTVTEGQQIPATIGAAGLGTAVQATAGGTGGTTTFGVLSATGGAGGMSGSTATAINMPVGGYGSEGYLQCQGGYPDPAATMGKAGGTAFGSPGRTPSNTAPFPAYGFGSGGGGTNAYSTLTAPTYPQSVSAAGKAGAIIIEYSK